MTRVTGWGRVCAVAVSVLGLIIVASPSVRAQAVYGSIAGIVLDSSGAPAAGASVGDHERRARRTADTVVTNAGGLRKLRLFHPGVRPGERGAHRVERRRPFRRSP